MLLGPDPLRHDTRHRQARSHLVPTSYVANFSSDDAVDDVRMELHDGVVSEVEAKPPIPTAPRPRFRSPPPISAARLIR